MDHNQPQDDAVWTRVHDDTGGGSSLTQFQLLYFHGDEEMAARAVDSAFGVHRDDGSSMYGAALSFREESTFADASWHERGCVYDQAARRPIDAPCGQSWRPYVSAEDWLARCVHSVEQAIAHRHDSKAESHKKMFFCPRAESLALAIRAGNLRDDKLSAAWSRELFERARSGLPPGPNHSLIANGLAQVLREASLSNMARARGGKEPLESWLDLADALVPSDFALARALAADADDLHEIDWAHLRLAAYPESRPAHHGSFSLDGLDPPALARLRLLSSPEESAAFEFERGAMRPRVLALLEGSELSGATHGARAPGTRARL